MPLAMLAVKYGLVFALVKLLGLSSPVGASLSLLWLACTVLGLILVYHGTSDVVLTLGYVVVSWLEGFVVGIVLTTAVLVSLGLQSDAHPPTPNAAAAVATTASPPGAAAASGAPASSSTQPPRPLTVKNQQGITLRISGHSIVMTLPVELRANGQLVETEGSTVHLHCVPANAAGFSLTPQTPRTGAHPLAWRLTSAEERITVCGGTVTLAHGGPARLNAGAHMSGFDLDPWITGLS